MQKPSPVAKTPKAWTAPRLNRLGRIADVAGGQNVNPQGGNSKS